MEATTFKIVNAKIITPTGIIDKGSLVVDSGKIIGIRDKENSDENLQTLDANGLYLSPGFIDIHVHGGAGHDFMDNSVDGFLAIARLHACHGTTAMTPTTLSSDKEDLLLTLETYKSAESRNHNGAAFLGVHIEGPYFAMNQRGAQDPRFIRPPDPAEYRAIIEAYPEVIRWSAAPELKGAIEFGRYLSSKKILPSIAHTDAIFEEVLEAFEVGYNHITHLYSCTSTVTRKNAKRFAGVVESAFLLDDMTVEIIADGVHLPPALLKLVYKLKGPEKVALITDAMRAAGMPEGKSILGGYKYGMEVLVEDGVAKLPDRSAFAGSVATADQLVRNMVKLAEVPLVDAVKMMSSTPATISRVANRKGSIELGKDADLVLFDDDIQIHCTIIDGRIIYRK
jgi:N-acetylglucosamine-6-phosphate deacetylase